MAGSFEILDERFRRLMPQNAPLETLGGGFRWLEGPVWFADHRCLLFSDIPNDRVMRWSEAGGVTIFRQPANFANGHARDLSGRLLTCSHRGRSVGRLELDGTERLLATHDEGRRLNSPNDIVVKRDGTIWFTDPAYGISVDYEGGKQEQELPPAVYRLEPEAGILTRVIEGLDGPNGLCFSPDESVLYVSDTGLPFAAEPGRHIHAYDILGGLPANGRVFHTIDPGVPDGMRCDTLGNVWSSAGDGVHCIAPDGTLIGRIPVPSPVSNVAFGDRSHCRLFICASDTLYAIYTNTRGAAWP